MINLGHGSSQIEILIWDVRNRNFDLGYPRLDLGHGHVWATTVPIIISLFSPILELIKKRIIIAKRKFW